MLLFVLERDVDAGAVGGDLALVDRHVEPADLGHAEIAEALGGRLDGILDRLFPGGLARAHQIRDSVDALIRHGHSPRMMDRRRRGLLDTPGGRACYRSRGRPRYARMGAT